MLLISAPAWTRGIVEVKVGDSITWSTRVCLVSSTVILRMILAWIVSYSSTRGTCCLECYFVLTHCTEWNCHFVRTTHFVRSDRHYFFSYPCSLQSPFWSPSGVLQHARSNMEAKQKPFNTYELLVSEHDSMSSFMYVKFFCGRSQTSQLP